MSKLVRLKPSERVALASVLATAIENSCSCNHGGDGGAGFLGHDRDCWVHINRKELRLAFEFLARTKGGA